MEVQRFALFMSRRFKAWHIMSLTYPYTSPSCPFVNCLIICCKCLANWSDECISLWLKSSAPCEWTTSIVPLGLVHLFPPPPPPPPPPLPSPSPGARPVSRRASPPPPPPPSACTLLYSREVPHGPQADGVKIATAATGEDLIRTKRHFPAKRYFPTIRYFPTKPGGGELLKDLHRSQHPSLNWTNVSASFRNNDDNNYD